MSTTIFVDTNVLLDVLMDREPHSRASAQLWTLCEQGTLRGHISVISFNNIYYIARKRHDKKTAQQMMAILQGVFHPVTLDTQMISQAIGSNMSDFEDAIQFHSAVRAKADFLITRNVSHFPKSTIPPLVVTPKEFLTTWSSKN
ncbi:MAG: PIN domain-containing protein [Phycisphaerales bacterium]|nr:PIN domain-containing protein [Phycisphaerales bacterium]